MAKPIKIWDGSQWVDVAINMPSITGHTEDTTNIHGITDTANLVYTNDSRLTDSRTPTAHASSHGSAGSDAITVAQSQVTNLTTDLSAKANLASPTFTGTPSAPTAIAGTNTTQIATTEFVNAEISNDAVVKSLIDAKGDLLVGSADNTVARQAVGNNGQILMADSGATNGIIYVDPPSNRNLIINGGMQISQRGTSTASITAGGYYTADRWAVAVASSAGTWTQSVENDGPAATGLAKSLKMLCTSAVASPGSTVQMRVTANLEGQDLQRVKKGTASAEQLTVSFWVKSNVTGTHIVELIDVDNNRNVSASYTISASATWERKTVTFPADTTGAFDNNNALSLAMTFWLVAGSNFTSGTLATTWGTPTNANRVVGQVNVAAATNNYWQITGVQLETGPVATPFEFEPYEATLRKCRRYYYRILGSTGTHMGDGQAYQGGQAIVTIPFLVEMRTAPTALEQSGTASHYGLTLAGYGRTACSAVPVFYDSTTLLAQIQAFVASGLGVGDATHFKGNTLSTYLAWSAEL